MKRLNKSVIPQTKRCIVPLLVGATVLLGTMLTQSKDTVPYYGKTKGQVAYPHFPDMNYVTIQEIGTGTHIGNFTMEGETGLHGYTSFTIHSANEDELYGAVTGESGEIPFVTVTIVLTGGTGRFKGATGNMTVDLVVDPEPVSVAPLTFAYTATAEGTISTVGSNKK